MVITFPYEACAVAFT